MLTEMGNRLSDDGPPIPGLDPIDYYYENHGEGTVYMLVGVVDNIKAVFLSSAPNTPG